jgi:hypothetical protein
MSLVSLVLITSLTVSKLQAHGAENEKTNEPPKAAVIAATAAAWEATRHALNSDVAGRISTKPGSQEGLIILTIPREDVVTVMLSVWDLSLAEPKSPDVKGREELLRLLDREAWKIGIRSEEDPRVKERLAKKMEAELDRQSRTFELQGSIVDMNGEGLTDVDMIVTKHVNRFHAKPTRQVVTKEVVGPKWHAQVEAAHAMGVTFRKTGFRDATIYVGDRVTEVPKTVIVMESRSTLRIQEISPYYLSARRDGKYDGFSVDRKRRRDNPPILHGLTVDDTIVDREGPVLVLWEVGRDPDGTIRSVSGNRGERWPAEVILRMLGGEGIGMRVVGYADGQPLEKVIPAFTGPWEAVDQTILSLPSEDLKRQPILALRVAGEVEWRMVVTAAIVDEQNRSRISIVPIPMDLRIDPVLDSAPANGQRRQDVQRGNSSQ